MSANDLGYRRIAAQLNRRGWNAALMHLPYHYSRVPRGYSNGALALTSNLPQNAETLRQAVTEVRQLMEYFRRNGCPDFGMIGTSYGGWVGALVSFVEREFRFVTLLQPIADIEHAIWESPASSMIRRALVSGGDRAGRHQAPCTPYLSAGWPACLRGETCPDCRGIIRHHHATRCAAKIGGSLARVTIHARRTGSLRLCRHAGGATQD